MSKAGYWLQAAIYQVALHRFLSMRIADYVGNEAKYLGAVEYVFLRGVYDPTSQLVTKAKEANVLSGGDSIASEDNAWQTNKQCPLWTGDVGYSYWFY